MDKVKKDARFAHIAKDPKFRRMKVNQRKVQIDKRFEGMFRDKSFKLKYSVDKRGRPVQKSTNEDLRKYYALNDSDDEENEKKKKKGKEKDAKTENAQKEKKLKEITEDDRFKEQFSSENEEQEEEEEEDNEEENQESEDDEEDEKEEEESEEEGTSSGLPGKMPDIARGEGLESSSSEEEEDDDEEDDSEDDEDHKWREMDKDAPRVEEATRRFAVCNMDWDRIKAHDLFMLFNSFKPASGVVKSVHIYPSEFGIERMKEEARLGPQELRKDVAEPVAAEDEMPFDKSSDDAKEEREKLRKYQLNRLKYYYAVVECDSAKTANAIYEECDGREYESSAINLDLRFIPDDMTFEQEPKSVATGVVDASNYKPNLFVNTALQQSKVDCTWDETDRDRVAVTMKKYSKEELENLDLKDYLASSSDEEAGDIYAGFIEQPDFAKTEAEDEEKRLEAYKELMQTIKDKDKKKEEKDTELEISWEPGLKETTEAIVKKKKKKETETVWEQYLEKKKEKKREKLKKTKTKTENNNTVKAKDDVSDDEDEEEEETTMSDDDIPSDVDLNDPYFKEELENQAGSNSEKAAKSKRKRKNKKPENLTPEEEAQKKKEQAELAMLMMDEDDDKEHFSLKAIMEAEKMSGKKKKKRSHKQMMKLAMKAGKKNVQDNFKMDLEDPRFNAVFDTADYNIDPSAPEFKATKNMESLIHEKLKRKSKKQESTDAKEKGAKRPKMENSDVSEKAKDTSLSKLVSSVKMKTKSHQIKKKL